MKKKLLAILLVIAIVAALAITLAACDPKDNSIDLKVGAIMVGDETEGYTEAHMTGIEAAVEAIKTKTGKNVEIVWKKMIHETAESCGTAIQELISAGCTLIISNSYGHQYYMSEAAIANPNVTFIAMTGDYAAITPIAPDGTGTPITNFKNAFTKVFEARYVSGYVAGKKLAELVAAGTISPEATPNSYSGSNIKLGYVGAYNYAEVVSGYTAFYLGVKSVVPNVVMDVKYTGSWFDFDKEKQAAEALIASGCVIIGQHADSEGAPTACENAFNSGKVVYSVGYNVDMMQAAPHAALTSATNNWNVYYEYAFTCALNGEAITTDWAEGYSQDAVGITAINTAAFTADPTADVNEIINQLKAGTLHVFDTSKFTVNGQTVTSALCDMSRLDFSNWPNVAVIYKGANQEAIHDGYFDESTYRSAPYFALRIDGITELAS